MLRDGSIDGHSAWCGSGTDDETKQCEKIHRTLKRIAKARAAMDAQEIIALRAANEQRIWRLYGCASLVEYMERELGYTPRAAVERLRVAQVMQDVPELVKALTQGDLSFSAARELARVATPETANEWISATEGKNVRQIEEMVAGHQRGARPSDRPDPSLLRKVLRYDVKPEAFAMMREVEQILEKERGERLDHDALIAAIYRAILDGPRDREGAAYQVAVTVCEACKQGWRDAGGLTVPMSRPAVERALCDAQEIGSLDGNEKMRARDVIPRALRRKVKRRDHNRCRVPGCRSRNLDIHHIKHVADGGTNDINNLVCLCESHHLAHHEGSLVITGKLPDLVFTRSPNHEFKRVTRGVETTSALRELGFKPHEVKAAVAATRVQVGQQDLPLADWIKIALTHCPKPI